MKRRLLSGFMCLASLSCSAGPPKPLDDETAKQTLESLHADPIVGVWAANKSSCSVNPTRIEPTNDDYWIYRLDSADLACDINADVIVGIDGVLIFNAWCRTV